MTELSIYASLHPCPHCHAVTIHALDDFRCALAVRLDPIPLNLAAELLALLHGRMTYDLVQRGAQRHIIIWRDAFRMEDREHTVLATHRCPGPIPATAMHKQPQNRKAANDQCPF